MLKKYWKLFILVLLIAAGIGIHYILYGQSSGQLQEFTFERLEGDAAEAENISFLGSIDYSMFDSEFQVTGKKGTKYLQDESFFKRLEGYYKTEKYEQRKKEYRNFMRGKSDQELFYDENDTYLAYAEISYGWGFSLLNAVDIDILNKETGDRQTFNTELTGVGDFGYVDIMGISMVNDNLHLIVETAAEKETNIVQYQINPQKGQVVEQQVMYTYGENNINDLVTANYLKSSSQSYEWVITEEKTVFKELGDGEVEDKTNVERMLIYDMKTGELTEDDVPTEVGIPAGFDDSAIYFQHIDGADLEVSKYDRQKKKIVNQVSVEMATVNEEMDVQHDIQNGKLYISAFSYDEVLPVIMVIDTASMEPLYKGKVTLDKAVSDSEYYNYFNEMDIGDPSSL